MGKKCSKTKQTRWGKITWWFSLLNLFCSLQFLFGHFPFFFLQTCCFFSPQNRGNPWINLSRTLTKRWTQLHAGLLLVSGNVSVCLSSQREQPGVRRGHCLSSSGRKLWAVLQFSLLCRWGMGLTGEMATEAIGRESDLSSGARCSGGSLLAFALCYFREKHPGNRCPETLSMQILLQYNPLLCPFWLLLRRAQHFQTWLSSSRSDLFIQTGR